MGKKTECMRNICLLFLLLTTPLFSFEESSSFSKAPPFSWVQCTPYPLEISLSNVENENAFWLLSDRQKNCEEHTTYYHNAYKLRTPQLVEDYSSLRVTYDPAFEKVVFHEIKVLRAGEWSDRLENSRSQVVQRETALDSNIYDGRQTILFFLDDIRQNDVLEYSFAVVGDNPNFASFVDEHLVVETQTPIEKVHRRVLAHPERNIGVKAFNTDLSLTVKELSPELSEWSWEGTQIQGHQLESGIPSWYFPFPYFQLSQYASWHEVIEQILPLYSLPQEALDAPPAEVVYLIHQWEREGPHPLLRACLALRFVQDEVRYLGFEEGIGGHQPRDPRLVFQRRFGDCKDKAFLLHYLLKLMHIDSKPSLVHTREGKSLVDALPAVYQFNHVVLKIDMDDGVYWVDPTLSLQGGSLQNSYFPNYHWGLVISKETEALSPIPEVEQRPVEFEVLYEVVSKEEALVTITRKFFDRAADGLRSTIGSAGRKKYAERLVGKLQRTYGYVTEEAPLEIEDRRWTNECTIVGRYRIPLRQIDEQVSLDVHSMIIRDFLDTDLNPGSTAPYALMYPLWVKEHVRIENPFSSWQKSADEKLFEHESFYYKFSKNSQRSSVDYFYELKHLKDHVPVHSMKEYWDKTKKAEHTGFFEVTICKEPPSASGKNLFDLLNSLFRKKQNQQEKN